jgi:hypothetical protein
MLSRYLYSSLRLQYLSHKFPEYFRPLLDLFETARNMQMGLREKSPKLYRG